MMACACSSLSSVRATIITLAPAAASCLAVVKPMPRGRSGHHHDLAGDPLAHQGRRRLVADVQVGLPVGLAQHISVVLDVRAADLARLERGARMPIIKDGAIGDVTQHRNRDAQRLGERAPRRSRHPRAQFGGHSAQGPRAGSAARSLAANSGQTGGARKSVSTSSPRRWAR